METLTTDDVVARTGVDWRELRSVCAMLEDLGIVNNDINITAYVHVGVARSSEKRLAEASEAEKALIDVLREEAPDDEALNEHATELRLRLCAERVRERTERPTLPEQLLTMLRSLARDGKGEEHGKGSLWVRKTSMDGVRVRLRRSWADIAATADLRREATRQLLAHLTGKVAGMQRADLLVESAYGELEGVVRGDATLMAQLRSEPRAVVDRALLWMHEQNVLTLNRGMSMLRRSHTLEVARSKRQYRNEDHQGLAIHYEASTAQIHIIAEYARLALEKGTDHAKRMAGDYFRLDTEAFIDRSLHEQQDDLKRQTLPGNSLTRGDSRLTQPVRSDAGADTLAFVDESGARGLSRKLTPDRDHELGLVCALLVPALRVQEFRDAFRPGYVRFADAMPNGAKLHITDAFASGNESWACVARRVRSEFHGLVHSLGIPLIYEARRLRIDRESHNLLHNIPSPDDSSSNSSPRLRGHPSRSRVESHLVLGLSLKLDAFCDDYQRNRVDLLFDNLDGALARLYRDTIERTRNIGNSTHIRRRRHPDPALRTEFKLSFETDSPFPLGTRFLGQLRIAGKNDPLVLAADSLANALYDHLTSLPSDAHLNRPSSIEGWDLAHRVHGVRDDAIEDII